MEIVERVALARMGHRDVWGKILTKYADGSSTVLHLGSDHEPREVSYGPDDPSDDASHEGYRDYLLSCGWTKVDAPDPTDD